MDGALRQTIEPSFAGLKTCACHLWFQNTLSQLERQKAIESGFYYTVTQFFAGIFRYIGGEARNYSDSFLKELRGGWGGMASNHLS